MKLFIWIQKSFENIGIYRNIAFENPSFNLRNCIILGILALNTVFLAMFLLFEVKTFGEYSEGIYSLSTFITDMVIVVQFVLKTSKIFELIGNVERTIEKRTKSSLNQLNQIIYVICMLTQLFHNTGLENPTLKVMYENMNEKIEKRGEMVHFALMDITLHGIMIPNLIMSYFNYFTTDMDRDAFRLAFPIWYDILITEIT